MKTELIGNIFVSLAVMWAMYTGQIQTPGVQIGLGILGGIWGIYSGARGIAKLGNDKTGGNS